jgi:hypothetical protein
MPTISRFCPGCNSDDTTLECWDCNLKWGKLEKMDQVFDRCPICTCRQFYTDKDFNQVIGFIIMGIGIVFVPLTYGLSLPVFAFIDWLIYKRVPKLVACYRCGSEFRGFPIPERLKPFMHHIGLKYDKYR